MDLEPVSLTTCVLLCCRNNTPFRYQFRSRAQYDNDLDITSCKLITSLIIMYYSVSEDLDFLGLRLCFSFLGGGDGDPSDSDESSEDDEELDVPDELEEEELSDEEESLSLASL